MKKILITGVSGFIGMSLYNFLSVENQVYGISRSNVHQIDNWFFLDLSKKGDTVAFFEANKFDVVIHLATILADQTNLNSLETFHKNLLIQANLLEALKNYDSCHLINFSSSAVYPNISGTFKESDEINPSVNADSLYGLAKFNGEMLFKTLMPKSITQLHLRVGFVYGKGMNPSRIHTVFVNELLADNHITVFGNGIRTIPQIEIGSLCIRVEHFIKNKILGTINIADENISLEALAMRTIKTYGNINSRIVYKPEGNQHQFRLDLENQNKILND